MFKLLMIFFILIGVAGCGKEVQNIEKINVDSLGYDEVLEFSDGVAIVKKDGKYGFIDKNGVEILKCEYDFVSEYYNSGAITLKDEKLGEFIDVTGGAGRYVHSPLELDNNDTLISCRQAGKYGFIDETGKEIIPFKYDSASNFVNGLACVKKDGKYGFININDEEVIEFKYDTAKKFSEGLACVKKDGKYGFINEGGKEVIDFKYDDANSFSESMAAVMVGMKWGFIDKTGKEVIPCQYEFDAEFSSSGEAKVLKDGQWRIIDKAGNDIRVFE